MHSACKHRSCPLPFLSVSRAGLREHLPPHPPLQVKQLPMQRACATAGSCVHNYYHLSPHIRAQVLCAPPRTRYVFLSRDNAATHATMSEQCSPQFQAFQLLLPPLKLALRLLKFGNCIVDDICDGGSAFFHFPPAGSHKQKGW